MRGTAQRQEERGVDGNKRGYARRLAVLVLKTVAFLGFSGGSQLFLFRCSPARAYKAPAETRVGEVRAALALSWKLTS